MNEFVARNGLIALDSSSISGPLTVSGRLGIGTTTPSYSLDVNGIARVGASGASGQLYIKGFAGTGQYVYLDDGSTVWSMVGASSYNIQKDGNNIFTINASNNVGIGTTSPTYKLHVSGGILSSGPAADLYVNSTSVTSLISINGSDTSTNIIGTQILSDGLPRWRVGMVAGRKFYIQPATGGGSFASMPAITILSGSGNVGISNTNPAQALDVSGNIIASGNVGIGTTTPLASLHVSGGAIISNGLTVTGSAIITQDLAIRGTYLIFGGPLSTNSIRSVGTLNRESLQYISGLLPNDTNLSDHAFGNGQGDIAITSGTRNLVAIARGFNPSSGTGVYNFLSITGIVSQSNATGISRGIHVAPTITNAADYRAIEWTNNTGWGLYGAGTAANFLGGSLRVDGVMAQGLGATADVNFYMRRTLTGSAYPSGIYMASTISSTSTGGAAYIVTDVTTQAASFTLPNLYHYFARQTAFGAGSTVTNQYGFFVESTLTGATNNYGFYGNIASGTGRWNLYMAGTANNYLAGNLGIGVVNPTNIVEIRKDQDAGTTLSIINASNTTGSRSTISIGVPGAAINISSIQSNYNQLANFASRGVISTDSTVTNGIVLTTSVGPIGFRPGNVTGTDTMVITGSNVGIGTTNPTYKLDISGSFRASGSITATSGSDYFDISHDITQPAQTGSQVYEVNITPILRYTAPNQTQTALRVAATFSGSTALSSSQSNIIADFGSTSAGSQLVINDTTSGSIYMVNDVSGLPIIEANSNWDVFIYDYPTKVFQKSGSNITISGSFNTSGSITIGSGSGDLYMYGHKMFSIGQFQNNSTLSGSANVSQSFVFDTTDFSEGVTLVSGSRLTVANAGYYNIQFSAQLQNTVNTTANLWIWFKRNGTNVPESATRVVLRKDEYHVAAWNFAYPANANDYFEIVWQSDSVDTRILYEPASGNIPIIPSIITTVTQIR